MSVTIYPTQVKVMDDVALAILAELGANGIKQGSLYVGASEAKPGDCCVLLVSAIRAPYSAITSSQNLASAAAATVFARQFALQWKTAQ